MEDVYRNIKMAREYAVLNSYETASVILLDMIQHIDHHIKMSAADGDRLHLKAVREACNAEMRLINDLKRELAAFEGAPPPSPNARANGGGPDPHAHVEAPARAPHARHGYAAPPPAFEDEGDWGFDDRRSGRGGAPQRWDSTPCESPGWDESPPPPPPRRVTSNVSSNRANEFWRNGSGRPRGGAPPARREEPRRASEPEPPRPGGRKPAVPKLSKKAREEREGGARKRFPAASKEDRELVEVCVCLCVCAPRPRCCARATLVAAGR